MSGPVRMVVPAWWAVLRSGTIESRPSPWFAAVAASSQPSSGSTLSEMPNPAATVSDLRSLRKSDPVQALELAHEAISAWPDDGDVRNAVSWIYLDCIFDKVDRTNVEVQAGRCLDLVRTMTSWTPSGEYSTSDATIQCVEALAKALNQLGRAKQALEALDLVRPADVTDKPSKGHASLRSRWYVERTRSLELLEQWQTLADCCHDAMEHSTIGRHSVEKIRRRLHKAQEHLDTL